MAGRAAWALCIGPLLMLFSSGTGIASDGVGGGDGDGGAVPDWVDDVHHFSFPAELRQPGARWSLSIDGDGRFSARIIPADGGPAVCADAHGPCLTNTDGCTTLAAADTMCEGHLNDVVTHRGPFLLIGFQGTFATTQSGGTMSDRLVFDCDTHLSCRPTNTVEWHCTFTPGTIHVGAAWGSEGGTCAFGSWNALQSGHRFRLRGSQEGDLQGLITHTVN